MKALFLGTFSCASAAAMAGWLDDGHEIVEFWHPRRDRRRRECALRLLAPQWSVTALLAKHDIVATPVPRLTQWEGVADAAAATGADVVISVLFGYIVPPSVLDRFAGRIVNVHPALLPRYRGPHPTIAMLIDRTIYDVAGVTLHVMTEGIDEGDIIAQKPTSFPIDADMGVYWIRIAKASADLVRMLPAYLSGKIVPAAQDKALASYRKIAFDRDLAIGSRHTIEEAIWLCRTVPPGWPLSVAGVSKIRIRGPVRIVGPPIGKPPIVRPLSIECDVADGRILVRRQTSVWRRLKRWRFYLLLHRTSLQKNSAVSSW